MTQGNANDLVEFRRWKTHEVGEDYSIVNPRVAVKPHEVAAVLEDVDQPTRTIIRMGDGRGFAVRGSYQEVIDRLGVHIHKADNRAPTNVGRELTPSGLEYEDDE